MLLVLSLALAAAGPPYLNGGIGRAQDDPNVVLRVLPGGPASPVPSAPTLAGSFGEALTFTRATSATCTPASGQVYTVASGAPCITEQGYRADPQSTNLITRSGDLSNAAWTLAGGPTVVGNTADVTAPDGTSTATKITYPAVAGGGQVLVYQNTSTLTAAAYSQSLYLRTLSGTATVYINQQFSNCFGTACTVTPTWSRCVNANQTLTAASYSIAVGFSPVTSGCGGQTNAAPITVYAWGMQEELGASSTSHIPTAGTTAQRNAEVLTRSTTGWPTTVGCVAGTYVLAATGVGNSGRLVDTASSPDGFVLQQMSATVYGARLRHAGTFYDATLTPASWNAGERVRISFDWDATGSRLAVTTPSGTVVATQGTVQVPTSLDATAHISNDNASGSQFGFLSDFVVGTSRSACP